MRCWKRRGWNSIPMQGATSLLCQKNGAEYLCLVLLVHLKKRQELNTYICSVLVVFKSAKSLLCHEFTSLLGNGSTMSLLVYQAVRVY